MFITKVVLLPFAAVVIITVIGQVRCLHRVRVCVCAGAFSPGVPTSFIPNYRAAMHFLDQVESICTTKTAFQVQLR